jgi:murein DD-endopeptidase MepM/ murein hydrolase activator NlpD
MTLPLRSKQMRMGTKWRYSKGGLHAAHDYPVPIGTPTLPSRMAPSSTATMGSRTHPCPKAGAPSNWILLGITYKGKPASVYYQHLSPGRDVKKGQHVAAGHTLANTGSSGHATGPHLHLAAMFGHRDADSRYAYMRDIGPNECPPTGTTSNGICIYSPSQVFGGSAEREGSARSKWASGLVIVDQLHFGTKDSDSVRRLQYRHNQIPLNHGRELPIRATT